MRRIIADWIGKKQRRALGSEEIVREYESKARELTKQVRRHQHYEMRISEVQPASVNPVYDRIKGRR